MNTFVLVEIGNLERIKRRGGLYTIRMHGLDLSNKVRELQEKVDTYEGEREIAKKRDKSLDIRAGAASDVFSNIGVMKREIERNGLNGLHDHAKVLTSKVYRLERERVKHIRVIDAAEDAVGKMIVKCWEMKTKADSRELAELDRIEVPERRIKQRRVSLRRYTLRETNRREGARRKGDYIRNATEKIAAGLAKRIKDEPASQIAAGIAEAAEKTPNSILVTFPISEDNAANCRLFKDSYAFVNKHGQLTVRRNEPIYTILAIYSKDAFKEALTIE